MTSLEEILFVENLDKLVKNTIVQHSSLLTILYSKKLISQTELESIESQLGNSQKATLLYKILKTKKGSFDVVLEALETEKQTGAAAILKDADSQLLQKRRLETNIDSKTSDHTTGNILDSDESSSWTDQKRITGLETSTFSVQVVTNFFKPIGYIVLPLVLVYIVAVPKTSNQILTFATEEQTVVSTVYTFFKLELSTTTITIPTTATSGNQNNKITEKTSSEQNSKNSVTDNVVSKDTQTTHAIFNQTDFKCKLTVKAASYEEFVQKLNLANSSCVLDVYIHLDDIAHWPQDFSSLPVTNNFENLTISGPFTALQIVNLLSQTPFLMHLHFKNDNNRLCFRNEGQLTTVHNIQIKAYLPVLRTLVLQNFTSYLELYGTILNGLIDNENEFAVIELLRQFKWSLKRFILTNTSIVTNNLLLQNDESLIMHSVKHLRIDVKTNENLELGKRFCNIFPNLLSFTNQIGYFEYNTAGNLLQCKNLTELSIGIDLGSVKDVNVSFLNKYFPMLKKAFIRLLYSECNKLGSREIVGWKNVTVPFLTVASNCRIIPVLPSENKPSNRATSYTETNGLFVFNYNLQSN